LIQEDPTQKITVLKTQKSLPEFVHEDDINKLLDHYEFSNDFQGWREKLILEILYNTGIRLSELIQLKTSSVDLVQRKIKVLGKRNKERIIPFNAHLSEILEKYMEKRIQFIGLTPDSFLIVTNSGNQGYPKMIYRVVKKYLSIFTTIDKKSPHVLRHTFATHLLNKGADLNAVKDLLGHASLTATQIYTHNSLDKLKRVFNQAHPKA
jgi:integrase/recombinase XerC